MAFAPSSCIAVAQTNLPELATARVLWCPASRSASSGAEAMRDSRASGAWLNDPEVNAYLNDLWLSHSRCQIRPSRQVRVLLPRVTGGQRLRAMPGGYIGVNLGLVLLTQSESELASVILARDGHT